MAKIILQNLFKNIAKVILKEELDSYTNVMLKNELQIAELVKINNELGVQIDRLEGNTELSNYYNNKYPKQKINYKRTDTTGTIKIDVRCFIQKNNYNYPEFKGTDDEIALESLKYVIKNVKYQSDTTTNNMSEYWQFPYQTLNSKIGDCEDGSLLLASIMLYNKIPSWKIRVNCGYVVNPYTNNTEGHAYTTYYCEETKTWITLDWCYLPDKTIINKRVSYKDNSIYNSVWFSFNDLYAWGNDADIRIAEKEMLSI